MSTDQQPAIDPRTAKAQAKADKAFAKASRPWFKKKRFLLPLALLVVIGLASMGGGDSDDSGPVADNTETSEVTEADTDTDAATEDEPAVEEEAPEPEVNHYDETYGTFKVVRQSGQGDGTITLPKATTVMVTMSHRGSANFAVTTLDANNQPTGDLLANTIGQYKGTAAYGLNGLGEPVKLKVTADGAWKIKIAPMSDAPQLPKNASGTGDAVFVYDGPAADWELQHRGQSNFAVIQYPDLMPNLMVNEIGSYKGTVPAVSGPSVVTITADGKWSVSAR